MTVSYAARQHLLTFAGNLSFVKHYFLYNACIGERATYPGWLPARGAAVSATPHSQGGESVESFLVALYLTGMVLVVLFFRGVGIVTEEDSSSPSDVAPMPGQPKRGE